ncbi:DUF5686 family protein [Chryseobacterium formosus]|uniref:DUF5686 family protein n=1 Tax=Chryseobacterium formosus TaxID=1537363 RepID=A0ABT3XW27_9FLAO|nr:DUF5686 family protein [Chryseobacterium formosus]MCX8525865.1 DUF5686 family protein [Chryseobacterium formosus]
MSKYYLLLLALVSNFTFSQTNNNGEVKTKDIEAVILQDKSDPRALEILRKVNNNYLFNSPESLPSYSYKSYEKISLDFDQDSIKAYNDFITQRIDSLKRLPERPLKATERKDSIESVQFAKLAGQSKLFLWERASEILFSSKYGEKINILDNKISGLKEPLYELMAFRSNRTQIPKEIKEENRNLYRYFLTDSLDIDGRENYVIRFRQTNYRETADKKKFTGYIYVDKETFGLKKIESNSTIENEGSITSTWIYNGGKWFLLKEDYKLKLNNNLLNTGLNPDRKKNKEEKKRDHENTKKFGQYAYATADYFDFKTNINSSSKDFQGYTIDVKNSDGTLIDQYRTSELSKREEETYVTIDSLSSKYKLDRKAKALTGLLKGKIRVGIIDFDLARVIGYNKYEHFRLGAGIKLNERFSKYISPDAYFAYGIYDEKFKFGAGVDLRTSLQKNSFFRIEYFNDVMAAGRFTENLWNFRMKIMSSGVAINNNVFYRYQGFKVSYENDLTNGLTVNVAAKKSEEQSLFAYNYKDLGNQFDISSAVITLKYSPKSKNIMTPEGKFTYEQNFPEVYFNYEQGFKGLDGNFNFSRFDVLFTQNFKTKLGVTGIRAYGGLLVGDAPIWKNFTMNGLANGRNGLNFNLTSYLGFATMEGGKYFNDRFAGTYLTHRLPWYFKSFGKNVSSFDFIYRGVIGDMKNPEYHQFEFEKLDHLYNEVGLEWNNFLSSQFNLGFFYRVGHYNTSSFKDNFAIQFKLKLLGF